MTKKQINVLILEDSETDAELIERAINSNGNKPQFKRAYTLDTLKLALREQKWDLIVSEFDFKGLIAPCANGFNTVNIIFT